MVTIDRLLRGLRLLFSQRVLVLLVFEAIPRVSVLRLAVTTHSDSECTKVQPPRDIFGGTTPLVDGGNLGWIRASHCRQGFRPQQMPRNVPPKSKRDQWVTDPFFRASYRRRLHRPRTVRRATLPSNAQPPSSFHTFLPSLSTRFPLVSQNFNQPWPRTRSSESFGSSCSSSSRGPLPASAPEFGSSFRSVCSCGAARRQEC
jgi:hypothetical protein